MEYVTISDEDDRGRLAIDLRDILHALGPGAEALLWEAKNVDCTGASANELEDIATKRMAITGDRLLQIAQDLTQTTDGEFTGRDRAEGRIRLIVRAVDSSFFDVIFEDPRVPELLGARFARVSNSQRWPAG